jgi:Family of unknown function (DUF6152)
LRFPEYPDFGDLDMRSKLVSVVIAIATFAVIPLLAHHSFSAEFDGTKPIQLKGIVAKIEWANPHVYFYIDVKTADGKVEQWGCETAGPGGLLRRGWKRDSLKIGDEVTVEGYRAKDGSKLADARHVTLPNGSRVWGGTPGDGGPGDPAKKPE